MNDEYACVYCGTIKTSPNGTGSDVSCCGEVGHVEEVVIDDDATIPPGEKK